MFKLIIEKELKEIIGSAKFAITFGVCAVLILLTFYVGAKNHQISSQRYEAAKAENLRQLEGLTDWLMVNSHRIFLPPKPLEALVTGVSNDIGRTIEMAGRGELTANDSRFGDDPIFAVFRFLDLDFVFQIVLSLFAILFAYDAINGEKERGTLRLSFANAIPRDKYILGKVVGSFLALAVPTGALLWQAYSQLSSLTNKSSHSFLLMLVIWIFAVLIIPRSSVLLAGRAVEVPTIDEMASQKNRLRSQLWNEDRKKMASFSLPEGAKMEDMHTQFQKFMESLAENRNQQMQELASRLNEDRRNRQFEQERLAFGIAKLSPAAAFSLAATNLVGTSLKLKQHYINEANGYQKTYGEFMKDKTGMNPGGGMIFMRVKSGEEEEKPIDPKELPPFEYSEPALGETVQAALFDIGLLGFFNLLFFAGAFMRFLKYDVR